VEHGAAGVNVGNPNIFNGSGIFKVVRIPGLQSKQRPLQVIYGLLVSPALTFLLAFAFYFFLYRTVVKVLCTALHCTALLL
jgi:hypothetical protein